VRFVLFLASILTAGAFGLAQGIIPLPAEITRAIATPGGDPAQLRPATADPAQTQNRTLPQIIRGSSAEDPGSRGSAVTLLPGNSRTTSSGSAANILTQIQQSNVRMQDLANYARNPSDWHGAPPR
jgi:hypothetical protein